MVERQRLEVQKLKSFQEDDNRDNDSQGSSDFCFSVRFFIYSFYNYF